MTIDSVEAEQEQLNDLLDYMDSIIGDKGDITDGGSQDGSEDKPFKIAKVEDFIDFLEKSREHDDYEGKYLIFENDIDFKDTNSYINPNSTVYGDVNDDGETKGLMEELTDENTRGLRNAYSFKGELDGNGYTMKNVWMRDELNKWESGSEDTSIGIIAYSKGTVKNLNVQGKIRAIVENGADSYMHVGGLVAMNHGNIINCKSEIDIEVVGIDGEQQTVPPGIRTGGICGRNNGLVDKCENLGNIYLDLTINLNNTEYSTYTDSIYCRGSYRK